MKGSSSKDSSMAMANSSIPMYIYTSNREASIRLTGIKAKCYKESTYSMIISSSKKTTGNIASTTIEGSIRSTSTASNPQEQPNKLEKISLTIFLPAPMTQEMAIMNQ